MKLEWFEFAIFATDTVTSSLPHQLILINTRKLNDHLSTVYHI